MHPKVGKLRMRVVEDYRRVTDRVCTACKAGLWPT